MLDMPRWLRRLIPETCILCSENSGHGPICRACRDELPRLENGCSRCAEPMMVPGEFLCGRCQNTPPAFDHVYSPWLYQDEVAALIRNLKFKHRLYIARALGTLLGEYLSHALHCQPDAIVPIPMHYRRLRARGFNQAVELARFTGATLDIPINARALLRTRATDPQPGQNPSQRHENVRNAFALHKRWEPPPTILLLDDVMTTGATANAAAKALKQRGAEEVIVAAVARAAKP